MGKISDFISNPAYFVTSPASKGWLDWVPDSIYLKLLYKVVFNRRLNLKHPVGYNEKLQWIKLNDRRPEYVQMVDKYEVRSYIEQTIGSEYLIPCLGLYESVEEIDYSKLPNQFVLKCTHDSGSVEICKDKSCFNIEDSKRRLGAACRRNYYSTYREWPYKEVKPRIIAEKYMMDEESQDLSDYKIMCFNGKAKVIEVHENRFSDEKVHTQTFYDREWNILPISQPGFNLIEIPSKKPAQLEELIRLSEILAKDIYHVRVDWYIVNEKIYFGEITFFDGSGFDAFTSYEMEEYLGNLIKLPCDKEK